MRQIEITTECFEFVQNQGPRLLLKFEQLIEVMIEMKVIHSNFIKKLQNTRFYELRIKSGNEYRIIIFTIDHSNFTQAERIICLTGFMKKSTKDYAKALRKAEQLLEEYLTENE